MKLNLLILSLILCININAANHYVSNGGNDGNDGSQGSPWATINKVNSSTGTGDFVYFNRGDEFFGNLLPAASGIFYGAYGTGRDPIITGMKSPQFGGTGNPNVYTSGNFLPQSAPKLLTINGVLQQIARWPNETAAYPYGYLSVDAINANKAAGTTDITDNSWGSLTKPAGYTTGGEMAFRMNRFRFVTKPANNGLMTVSGSSMSIHVNEWLQGSVVGYGYFLQNDPHFLDKQGEWCWNEVNKTISVYITSGPTNYNIRVPYIDEIVSINGRSNITLQNLDIEGANTYGIDISGGSNITINNCTVNNCGRYNTRFSNVSNLKLTGNTFDNAFQYAISGSGDGTTLISRNTIQNVFPILGMGDGGNVAGTGVNITGSNKTISRNYFKNMGYAGIVFFNGSNMMVERNIIDGPNQRIDDGGALYTDNHSQNFQYTNIIIRQNIIKNVESTEAYKGTGTSTDFLIYSLYADQWTKGVVYDGNIVEGGKLGWYANDPLSNTIKNNFFYNQRQRNIEIRNKHTDYAITGNSFTNNVMFSTLANGSTGVVANKVTAGSLSGYGVMNNNYYIRPYRSGNFFTATINGVSNGYTKPAWTSLYGFEANSQLSIQNFTTQNPAGYTRFRVNESDTVQVYDMGPTEWYTARNEIVPVNSQYTLQPFTAQGFYYKSGAVIADPNPPPTSGPPPTDPPPVDPGPDPSPPPPPEVPNTIKIKGKFKIIHVTLP